ncbi:flagellin lysine-N-methylase [Paenibacillus nasutitermitis]|uniref:Flagellin lysine-N-methylase n=1 Tax=Paenibacillus nasutitermitis TaxID=1652958 RepID=A0A916ZEH3_9BACL|nr:flagellin lysine-N-methylase [Paenibacillus nasutitermitis]GGD92199.1 flagellin lysine-N-methylase [Paenibacillus nasutitermitis]
MTLKLVKTRPILVPAYMQEFACIGSACEDSCCAGWRVNVDQDTYKKYQRTRDLELKPLLDKNVTRQRSQASSVNYAKIKMDNTGRCSLLTEDNLCKVQLTLGEDYLSNTCSIYPRAINRVNGMIEKSATMSCPEAARLALLNPNGIVFEQTQEPTSTRGFVSQEMQTDDHKVNNKPDRYLWDLRIFTIQVLQNRIYSLSERLILLGMFYQKVQTYIEQEKVHQIPDLIASYTQLMSDEGLRDSLLDIPTNLAIQMELCKELMDFRFGHGIRNNRYMECLQETLAGIQYTAEATVEEITERYKIAFDDYYEPFMKEHEYILENYLVNHVFKNLFPLGQKTIFDDYVMMIVHYSMIKLHLIGMSGYHKGLSTELVIKLIQSFAKIVEHNKEFLRKVFKLLNVNEFTTMAYMAILIKN